MTLYIGIDPGANGAIALLIGSPSNYGVKDLLHLKGIEDRQCWEWVRRWGMNTHACIEEPGTGFPGSGKSQVAKLWGSYRALRMCLICSGIPVTPVAPQTWQRALGIKPRDGKGGETEQDYKRRLKGYAQHLFPSETVTLWSADAFLIALYCLRRHTGAL